MKLLYFFITSSLLIGLVLLFRKLFRKKLAANVIYALWLLPFLRLLIPIGFIEVPLFGTATEFINRSVAVVEEFFESPNEVSTDIYDKSFISGEIVTENSNVEPQISEGVKIYDAVVLQENPTVQIQENNISLEDSITEEIADNQSSTNYIIITIWCTGSAVLGYYVLIQNRKLRREINQLKSVEQIEGLEICVSKLLKTPCLVGVYKPRIVLTGDVYLNHDLYEYAIQHELAHYQNKDHFWNVIRIFLCILYWWHPFVWYGVKCMAEDAELACDERVLRHKTLEERKNYGYALLKMIENAQNKPLCFATSFSGNKKSVKNRIEAISNKTITKKRILFPAILVLICVLLAGCVNPSTESYLKTTDWKESDTKEWMINENIFSYFVQKNLRSYVVYGEIYEYGELVKTDVLGTATIENYNGSIKLCHKTSKAEDNNQFILKIDNFGIEMESLLSNYPDEGGYAYGALQSDKNIEIIPEKSYVLSADYKTDNDTVHAYSCSYLSDLTESELTEQLKNNYAVGLYRIVFSELSSDELYKKYSLEDINTDWSTLADSWAKAFINKDVESIQSLATENACQQLIDSAILDEDRRYFGWSSPWPMFAEQHYRIIYCNSKGAEILYYAIDSTPHVYVWKETLEFSSVENKTKVFSWSLERFEEITELDEYRKAYPNDQISGTSMDYYINGLGDTLNNNAMLSSSETYHALFEAGSAALQLLNVSKDYSLVQYNTEKNGEETNVHIWFLNEDGSTDGTSVTMWQPYGKEGIWIPKGEIFLSLDEYNETYSKKEFSTEPEENKVCLAVMPDGISKAGGDYRYIIPEDQVKWTDQYKQARSLVTNGGWKDGEHSTGVWIVLNDEWTCISDKGMIFDFDKRVEKEQIEDFYNLCIEEAKKFGTGTPINPENFPEIISATLNYNGACTITDANVLKDLRKMIFTSKEIRGGSSCPFTAALVLESKDGNYEIIYLATDSCSAWLTDGVYYEYFGYDGIEELSEIFESYGAKIDAEDTILEIENNQANISLKGNTLGAIELIKQAEERVRAEYKEATLTYVDNAEVRWDYYTDNPWASNAERDALAQAALKELYTLTGYQVEECTYTTDGRSKFIFGKSAEYIKKNIAFYSRDYGFWLCGDNVPFIGFMNARKVHYSDVQQLDSPFDNDKIKGLEQVSQWFLERSGLYQGEMITGYEKINLDDTVYTHMRMNFDGGYYIVVMDEKIESIHNVMGPYME